MAKINYSKKKKKTDHYYGGESIWNLEVKQLTSLITRTSHV